MQISFPNWVAPTSQKFLQALFVRLADGNTAFSEFNSVEKLCVGIGEGAVGNASATSSTGTVRVERSIFKLYNEVEIAAILAHEAAHLLMRHTEIGPLPHPLLSRDDTYKQVWADAAKAQARDQFPQSRG